MKRLIILMAVPAAAGVLLAGSASLVAAPVGSDNPAVVAASPGSYFEDFSAGTFDDFAAKFDHGWSGEWNAGAAFNDSANDWHGDHDMSCANPNLTNRTIHLTGQQQANDAAFYTCVPGGDLTKAHLMTSVNTEGYVTVWFSPKQVFSDIRRVCWDQNITDLGGGKWTAVDFLTPSEYQGQTDLGYTTPDFPDNGGPSSPQGPAMNGAKIFDGSINTFTNGAFHGGASGTTVTDKAGRYRHCVIDNENGTLTTSIAQEDGSTVVKTVAGAIPNGSIRVVFIDDSYNPDKHFDAAGRARNSTGLYTWHWDNLEVSSEPGSIPTGNPPPVAYPPSVAGQFDALSPARLLDTRAPGSTIDGQAAGGGRRGAGSVTQLQVGGRGGVANDVRAASLNVTVVNPSDAGYVTVYPCDAARPTASNVNFRPGEIVANAVISDLDSAGKLCLYTSAATDLVVDGNGAFPAASSFRPLVPARLADTRPGSSTVDGGGAGAGVRPAGSVTEVTVAGRGGVPSNAQDVVLNVTVADTQGDGFATLYPCGQQLPLSSNVNYRAGEAAGRLAVTALGAGGKVCIFTRAATDLVVDAEGWFPAGDSFGAVQPARLLDTRAGSATVDGAGSGGGKRGPAATIEVQVGGRAGVPGNAGAAALNVTIVGPESDGYATVYPCGQARPLASNVNYRAGLVVPNFVLSRLGSDGKVCVFVNARADVVVDVMGWFLP